MKRFLPIALAVLLLVGANSYAAVLNTAQVNDINRAAPRTNLGTKIKGLLADAGLAVSSTSTMTAVTLTPTYAAYVYTSGSSVGNSYALGAGSTNQPVTFVLATDGGTDITISPDTKTGFTNIHLNDAKDSVTMKYIDSTVGWVITGNNGATVN